MNLLKQFLKFVESWEESFSNPQAFKRAKDHAIASLLSESPHTLTSIIGLKGLPSQDWSADYYLYSRAKWELNALFNPLLEDSLQFFKEEHITIAADDTAHRKTGKKILTAFYQRDPMSLPFHPNLLYGIRFLALSLTLPLYLIDRETSCRAVPIRYVEAPFPKKPTKRSSEQAWMTYEKLKKTHNISLKLIEELKELRETLDQKGAEKPLLVTTDGAYSNRNYLNQKLNNTDRITRCRKDIKLCFKASKKDKRRFYGTDIFTPQEIYNNPKIPWKRTKIFRAGRWRWTWIKEVNNVFWRTVTKRMPLKLIVIKRIRYKKRAGYLREPGYLLVTNPLIKAPVAVQAYFDHNQIELNIKEGKSILGVGHAQVRNKKSVSRQPAFVMACYSALLLSSVKVTKDRVLPLFGPLPRWRKKVKRPSIRMLIKQLKKEVLYEPSIIYEFKLPPKAVEALLKIAA